MAKQSRDLPSLSALRAFETAGRTLNFRVAAEDLGVTQAAVAQQVRSLEAQLDTRLFLRQHRTLALTEAGKAYHREISAAFSRIRDATRLLSPSGNIVTISVTPTFASKWLLPRLGDLTQQYPDIELRIVATESVSRLHQDGIDIAVRQGEPLTKSRLDIVRLFPQEIIAVSAPGYVERHGSPFESSPASDFVLLHDTHDLWPTFLRLTDGRPPSSSDASLRFNQTAHAIDAALAGQGITLASRFLVAADLAANRLVETVAVSLQGEKDFFLVTQIRASRSNAVDRVRQWLMAHGSGG